LAVDHFCDANLYLPQGISFGAPRSAAGELVFSTGMVGYPDALTDPSYRGQILVLTYPLIGNYGVPSFEDRDKHGIPLHFESDKIHVAGLIVSEYSQQYSHWNAVMSLSEWLVQQGVPAIYGVDTRMLTKRIRDSGAMLGKLEFAGQPVDFVDPNDLDLGAEVSTKEVHVYNQGSTPRILAFDCGIKYNILRYFVDIHAVEFTLVPYDYDLEANPANLQYDGIFISNGPGDPAKYEATIRSLRWAMAMDPPVSIFGICMGNQLLALAAGARTYKMKYGNRGMNQPCVDLRTTKCYITAQNHGFAVDATTLPSEWKVSLKIDAVLHPIMIDTTFDVCCGPLLHLRRSSSTRTT
jgi:carbamoyl-phosphate synthase/aspartate carbamoyltransferase